MIAQRLAGQGGLHVFLRNEMNTTNSASPAKMPTIMATVLPTSSCE